MKIPVENKRLQEAVQLYKELYGYLQDALQENTASGKIQAMHAIFKIAKKPD